MAGWRCGRPTRCRRISAAGYAKFAKRTQFTGSLAFGWANNDEPLLPFTINSALPQLTLPRATADASAHDNRDDAQPRLPPGRRLAVQRPVPPVRLQQRDARHTDSATSSATTRRSERARRAGRCSTHTPAIRSTPTPRGPASAPWRSPSDTRTTTTAMTFASSSRRTRTSCSSRQTRPVSAG